jgi:hypothetical protein
MSNFRPDRPVYVETQIAASLICVGIQPVGFAQRTDGKYVLAFPESAVVRNAIQQWMKNDLHVPARLNSKIFAIIRDCLKPTLESGQQPDFNRFKRELRKVYTNGARSNHV